MCTNDFIGMMFTVDLYGNRGFDSHALGSRVWGKGDCGPFESPLRRSSLGLLQSIQYRYSRYMLKEVGMSFLLRWSTHSSNSK